jgi:hypothetical protein
VAQRLAFGSIKNREKWAINMADIQETNWVESIQTIKGKIKTSCVLVPRAEYETLKKVLSHHEYILNTAKESKRAIYLLDQCNPTFLRFQIMNELIEILETKDNKKSFRKWDIIRELKNPYLKTSLAAFNELVNQGDIEDKKGGWFKWPR